MRAVWVLKMDNINVHVDTQNDLAVHTVVGDVSADEVQNSIRKFYEGTVTNRVLWDFTNGAMSGISSSEVQRIAYYPRKHAHKRNGGKAAIVAPKEVTYGLSRMYELLTELRELPFETRAFRTPEEAYEWLLSKD